MAPVEKYVNGGVDALLKEIEQVKPGSSIYILFCASKNEKGESWCPDCVKAEPIVNAAAKKLSGDVVFIHYDVGPREQWKPPTNPFRVDERFRLTAVPTLIKWKSSHRLVEGECWNADLLSMIFEGDTE